VEALGPVAGLPLAWRTAKAAKCPGSGRTGGGRRNRSRHDAWRRLPIARLSNGGRRDQRRPRCGLHGQRKKRTFGRSIVAPAPGRVRFLRTAGPLCRHAWSRTVGSCRRDGCDRASGGPARNQLGCPGPRHAARRVVEDGVYGQPPRQRFRCVGEVVNERTGEVRDSTAACPWRRGCWSRPRLRHLRE
jgi:hypothetical protein